MSLYTRFSDDGNVDWAIWMNLVIAAGAAHLAYYRLQLGWWTIAVGVGLFAFLTAALWQRHLVWIAAIAGTPAGAFVAGALSAIVINTIAPLSRNGLVVAALPGAIAGGWFTARAYRRILVRRRTRNGVARP